MRKIIVGPAVAAALVAAGGADAAAETEPLSSVEASNDVLGTTDGNDTLGNDTTGNDTTGNDTTGNDTTGNDTTGNDTTSAYGFERLG